MQEKWGNTSHKCAFTTLTGWASPLPGPWQLQPTVLAADLPLYKPVRLSHVDREGTGYTGGGLRDVNGGETPLKQSHSSLYAVRGRPADHSTGNT